MTLRSDDRQRFGLGAIDQISFAVRDVAEAVPRYEAMFGGPMTVLSVPGVAVKVGGVPSETTLELAFGANGELEIELVEVVDGLWPTTAWLDERGEGLHHVRYPVADVAASRAEMEAEGFTVSMESADGTSFVYLRSPLLDGMTVELIASPTG